MYSTSSPWQSQGQASPSQIQAWFKSHTPGCPDLGQAIYDEATAAKLNPDLVAAQVAEETGWWSSQIATTKNNPAGLGAVDGNALAGAITFPTPRAGIHAQCAHLLSYVLGASNPLKGDDPRWSAMPVGYLGTRTTLGQFGAGVWASDPDYATKLVAHANSLMSYVSTVSNPVSNQNGATVANPTQADIGSPVVVRQARDIGPARSLASVIWAIVHYTGAFGWPGQAQYLLAPGDKTASATAVIGRNGELWYEVPIENEAYTAGNDAVGLRAVQVELESDGSSFSDAQYRSLAAFFNWCRARGCQFPAEFVGYDDRPGILGHMHVADPNNPGQWGGVSHHTDPGPNFNWSKLVGYMTASTVQPQVVTPPAPVQPAERIINGHKLSGGFRSFYEDLEARLGAGDALQLIGLPLTDELEEGGMTVQYFERARFEWHPDRRPDRWDVLLGLLGAQALAAKQTP